MATTQKPKTFNAAMAELEQIAARFESDAFDIEKGLKDFERGLELAAFCKGRLNELELRVKTLQEQYAL